MKRIFIITTLLIVSLNGYNQFKKLEKKKHNVNKVLSEIINDEDFKNANFGFLAIDVNSGEVIAKQNSDRALKPASTQKVFSTATALELYGPDYKFKTTLEYTGKIDHSCKTLIGDIIIKGGGDPALGSKYFPETKEFISKWLMAIKALGIDSIAGRIIGDASLYSHDIVPTTWSWQDIGNYYGAGACGLSVYDNYYSIYFKSGNTVGDTVEISKIHPEVPGLTFDNAVLADSISYDNAYIFGAPYNYYRYLRGEIPLNKKDFIVKGSFPDPAYIAALELEHKLKENNIQIRDEAITVRNLLQENITLSNTRKIIYTNKSPELLKIITETNVHSINLYAEHCLNHSGIKMGVDANTYSCAEALEDFWEEKGMDVQGLSINDGSGLSHYNLITPKQMVFLLEYMRKTSKHSDEFFSSLPVAGKTGTIRNMFKESAAEGQLRAKSGTINRVKAYAGYVTSTSGREIAFSVCANGFSCSSVEARAKLERLMISLADFDK